ncbi:hypothetical protein H4O18_06985 [Arenibacter sp. BSSL-BM3]|uniref:SMODS-associated and fused to various effectors domain-containing protein n=1 Tax=Arenibacter arenosicollis TaxID=2762274 RepID=A0ABR7QL96_9FLAO|nr:hypothetical protein [Arenibacter arenosicollis]MBC8767732.1 hypothetical protein [Arenibacter arenosicollis]
MKIKFGKQIEVEEMVNIDISLFLFGKNHEKRVFTAYNRINANNKIRKSIALLYKEDIDEKDSIRQFDSILIKSHLDISELLNRELQNFTNIQDLKLVVDYSCMTKPWYYTLILFLNKKNLGFKNITVYFVYTPSKFTKPFPPKPNSEVAPLPGKYIVPTDKPKALVVCLGYEQNKAEGIIEHLDPKISYLFYTKPALDSDFVSTIEENNANLLSTAKHIVEFPVNNLLKLERELTSVYYLLKDEYSIIIAPLGPKPFTFISMLLAIKFDNIDIWRVGSGSDINEYDREPIDENTFIISKVVFE